MLDAQPTAKAQVTNQPKNWKTACAVFLFCVAAAITAQAQKFTTLASFNGANGNTPNALVQGTDGNFYGTTIGGGANSNSTFCGNGCGTVFRVTPTGALTLVYSFCGQSNCSDGASPVAGLVQGTDGKFYGGGSAPGCGTLFKITKEGVLTILQDLQGSNGCSPSGAMVLSTYAGGLYGTTYDGGMNGGGTVFRISRSGALSTIYNAFPLDAASLAVGALTEGLNGKFYGATQSHLGGDVFVVTPGGTVTYTSVGWPNFNPNGGLALGRDGNLYGTSTGDPNEYPLPGCCGTVFRLTPKGNATTLYTFCQSSNCADGQVPTSLVQGTDGNFYGTTYAGGSGSGRGTIFKITGNGKLTTLHLFCMQTNCADGGTSFNGLIQGTDGKFYGVTDTGGANNYGTVFSLDVGLKPFVKAQLNSGIVGSKVVILGNNLTDTTAVKFNGAASVFTVVSDTEIIATVPRCATTGNITVTTPSRTLASNVPFRVTPRVLSFSPKSGPVGTHVVITGKSFTQATAISLACKWAMSFTVDSNTQITAIVPTGAPSGRIGVTTAGGHAESAASFTVTP